MKLVVESSELEFPRTFVGYPTVASVVIDNTGRMALPIGAETTAPFALEGEVREIEPGSNRDLPIRFAPESPGIYRVPLDGSPTMNRKS